MTRDRLAPLTLVSVLLLGISSACGGGTPEPPRKAEATGSPEPAGTPAVGSKLTLGIPASPTAAVKATVLQYQPRFTRPARSDVRYAAVLIRLCSTGIQVGGPVDFGPTAWRLRSPGDRDYESIEVESPPANVQPPLRAERVPAAGKCVEGWAYYEVPAKTPTPEAAFVDGAGDLAVWELRKP